MKYQLIEAGPTMCLEPDGNPPVARPLLSVQSAPHSESLAPGSLSLGLPVGIQGGLCRLHNGAGFIEICELCGALCACDEDLLLFYAFLIISSCMAR